VTFAQCQISHTMVVGKANSATWLASPLTVNQLGNSTVLPSTDCWQKIS